MSLNITGILDAVVSKALATGHFERVNAHEPKNSPGNGLTAAVWLDELGNATGSGLKSTSGRVTLNVRAYSNMLQEPQDAIDPNLVAAVDALFEAYSSDFDLGGLARCVDLLGMSGQSLSGRAGYLSQDGKMFRVFTLLVPIIVNDIWDQE